MNQGENMQLIINNIAKVNDAVIELNGLTVIAGANNTGKSTINKIFYCMFNSFYNIEEKIHNERKNSIKNEIKKFIYYNTSKSNMRLLSNRQKQTRIADDITGYIFSKGIYDKDNIKSIIKENIELMDEVKVTEEDEDDFINKLLSILNIGDLEVLTIVATRYFNEEFHGQVNNVEDIDSVGSVVLAIKNQVINVLFKSHLCISIKKEMNLSLDATFIDNPYILDEIDNPNHEEMGHRKNLVSKLEVKNYDVMEGIFDEVINRNKIENIINILSKADNGRFVEIDGEYGYIEKGKKNPVKLASLSTGLKTFLIIKRLIENNAITQNGILILDEPEIHLHPDWQLILAETLILLQKEFNLNILLTTHSPYFLHAIEVYSLIYKTDSVCRYYYSSINCENKVTIQDVTENTDVIYKSLASSLQILEDLMSGRDIGE
jgi:predicted ATP-dependent endonuclease of OLD family